MEQITKDHFYIYDLEQANFYIEYGVKVAAVFVGIKGEPFTKFVGDDTCQQAFNKWKEYQRKIKQAKEELIKG